MGKTDAYITEPNVMLQFLRCGHRTCMLKLKCNSENKKEISKFLQIWGVLNQITKPNVVQTLSQLKLYNILAIRYFCII